MFAHLGSAPEQQATLFELLVVCLLFPSTFFAYPLLSSFLCFRLSSLRSYRKPSYAYPAQAGSLALSNFEDLFQRYESRPGRDLNQNL